MGPVEEYNKYPDNDDHQDDGNNQGDLDNQNDGDGIENCSFEFVMAYNRVSSGYLYTKEHFESRVNMCNQFEEKYGHVTWRASKTLSNELGSKTIEISGSPLPQLCLDAQSRL